jgi:hypothetical protein
LLAFEQSGLREHLEVVTDCRLAEAERFSEMADAGFAFRLSVDQAQESKARRIGKHLEGGCDILCVVGCEGRLSERRAAGRDSGDRLHAAHID